MLKWINLKIDELKDFMYLEVIFGFLHYFVLF